MHLLIVEEHGPLNSRFALELESKGHSVQVVVDGISALAACRRPPPPDLLILTLNPPDLSHLDLYLRLRHRGFEQPILILGGHTRGIEAGMLGPRWDAKEDLHKPLIFEELLADLKALHSGSANPVPGNISTIEIAEDTRPTPPHPLSDRELEVLGWMTKGCTNREIAERLVLSPETVKSHIKNIFRKLNIHDRVKVIIHALETGILTDAGTLIKT